MAFKADDSNTKITVELETGDQKKDPSKKWEGVRVRIGDATRVIFFTRNEMSHIKKVLEANE